MTYKKGFVFDSMGLSNLEMAYGSLYGLLVT